MSGPEQRGSRSLQQQLAAAGDDYDTLCRLIVAFQINTGARFPRTAQDAVSAIRQHIDNTARSFYDVRERMVTISTLGKKFSRQDFEIFLFHFFLDNRI